MSLDQQIPHGILERFEGTGIYTKLVESEPKDGFVVGWFVEVGLFLNPAPLFLSL